MRLLSIFYLYTNVWPIQGQRTTEVGVIFVAFSIYQQNGRDITNFINLSSIRFVWFLVSAIQMSLLMIWQFASIEEVLAVSAYFVSFAWVDIPLFVIDIKVTTNMNASWKILREYQTSQLFCWALQLYHSVGNREWRWKMYCEQENNLYLTEFPEYLQFINWSYLQSNDHNDKHTE